MEVTRFADANPYEAPKHFDCTALRLQGWDASAAQNFCVGLSHFLPGGGVEMDATPLEKVYVVHRGRDHDRHRRRARRRSAGTTRCYLAPNEARSIENRTNMPASMLVVMPYPPGVR